MTMAAKKRYKNAMYQSDGNETIESVAICYGDGRVEYLDKPYRHHDIIKRVFTETGENCKGSNSQGFLTNTGRFVSRVEARIIAIDSGQVNPEDTIHKTLLFSEDLW